MDFWHKDSDNETAPNALFLKMKYVLKKFLNQNFNCFEFGA